MALLSTIEGQLMLAVAVVIALGYFFSLNTQNSLEHIPLAGTGSRRSRIQNYHLSAKSIYAEACKKVRHL